MAKPIGQGPSVQGSSVRGTAARGFAGKDLRGTIFIVTYGRSGSTLLQSVLQSIPGAHIRGENGGALEGLFRASSALRQAHKQHGIEPHPADHPWHGMSEVRVSGFERRLAQAFVTDVLRPPEDARWIGFKEVRYIQMGTQLPDFLNFCRRVFHNPFFVFNSRNIEDVAKSGWWATQPLDEVRFKLKRSDEIFARYAGNNPDVSHHVVYEEMLANPGAMLRPLFDKLDEPYDAARVAQIMGKRLTH